MKRLQIKQLLMHLIILMFLSISVPLNGHQVSLYQKLSTILDAAQQTTKKETAPKPSAPELIKTNRLPLRERKKYEFLYREIVGDATMSEKIKKTIALAAAWHLAYNDYFATPYKPLSSFQTLNPTHKKRIKTFLDLIGYALLYKYVVGQERMSLPLAAAGAFTASIHHGQTRALFFYWILSHLFLETTTEKLSYFLDRDAKEWEIVKRSIPEALFKELDDLHNAFLKNEKLSLTPSELNKLIKKISFGTRRIKR